MKLLIVESPGKVKKIQGFLGDGWKVGASVGHVRDLPTKEIGVHPPDFRPSYVETGRGHKIIGELRRLASGAESVWLATDPDREGEAIAWHLKESLRLEDPHRVTYAEITGQAIAKALERPRKIDLNLVRAQEGRRVLDRLVGYGVSPALTGIAGKVLSAGRVQTPALRLVVEREEAIRAFRQTTHFGVELTFDAVPNVREGWKAVWDTGGWMEDGQEHFLDKEMAGRIAAIGSLEVTAYEEGTGRQAPPAPFTTSTLQQAASNALGLDPKETMALAQRLYEQGHITYMRTDSPNLSQEAIADIRGLASGNDWPVPARARAWKSREGAQEAHEAIRPTHADAETAGDTEKEAALYGLIRMRAVASQLDDAVFSTARATLRGEVDGREVLFEAKGRRLESPGWKIIMGDDQADETDSDKDKEGLDNPVPALREGAQVSPGSGATKTRKTTAPPRFTQASLIRELEKRGIGRPSTYAAIMENISNRNYVRTNGKRQLEPTGLGEELIKLVKTRFDFADYGYTRNLEDKLDDIAKGSTDYLSVVREANDILETQINRFKSMNARKCGSCGQDLRHIIKEGKDGYNFWACADREKCGARFTDDNGKPGHPIKPADLSSFKCEACGKFLRHFTKSDPDGYDFWGCPDRGCSATYDDDGGKPGRRRTMKNPPTRFKCEACHSPLYRRTGFSPRTNKDYDFFSCPNKSCGKTYNVDNDKPIFKNTNAKK
ncbi:MAG: type I DNA topoisomerase [Deltaproteobacteria bacterium]|jgi:DNA topoisomerase-1|nr:type I DNA topoisomerase [Deltaproteobacteria bacterium]